MNIPALVRDFGIPVALLVVAVTVLWRAWRLEHRLRVRELEERLHRLTAREDELNTLYRKLALRKLNLLIRKRKRVAR